MDRFAWFAVCVQRYVTGCDVLRELPCTPVDEVIAGAGAEDIAPGNNTVVDQSKTLLTVGVALNRLRPIAHSSAASLQCDAHVRRKERVATAARIGDLRATCTSSCARPQVPDGGAPHVRGTGGRGVHGWRGLSWRGRQRYQGCDGDPAATRITDIRRRAVCIVCDSLVSEPANAGVSFTSVRNLCYHGADRVTRKWIR